MRKPSGTIRHNNFSLKYNLLSMSTHKKRIFLCIGSQGQTSLARGMEEGDTSFPSKTDLMAYFYLLI